MSTGVKSGKGAADAIATYVKSNGGVVSPELQAIVDRIARSGGTPLVVAERTRPLGVVHLKDIVKGGMRQRFAALRAMGIKTVMITGDNPLTAASIANEAGVDDFLAQATPEDKMALIRREQSEGKLVAMTGDGTNDAPALAQADVGVAMNTGTTAAKEAGNMVDLDSNPTKLIEIVEIGKQLLMTRGALTTFSIANDVAKYFAIIPAMFILAFPQLGVLNIMRLATPESAILSAVIFNAVIIIALIPLALRGIAYKPLGAAAILRRNLLIYGLGGVLLPFVGIKAIDVVPRGRGPGVSDVPAPDGLRACAEQRPTADALLARIKDRERARLRIYIGAAPGVGKTYEMLQEAHALRARGLDVVIGYRRDLRPARHRGAGQGSRGRSRAGPSSIAASPWRRWTSTPSSAASLRCASSTNWRTPTCRAAGTRSATRTCSRFSTPAFT